MTTPIDMEVALSSALSDEVTAYPMPLPRDFDEHLPCVLVTRTGGEYVSRVVNTHSVSIDVYAKTWGAANTSASTVAGLVMDLVGKDVGGKSVRDVDCGIPYANPDPRHEDMPRVTMTATLTVRGKD